MDYEIYLRTVGALVLVLAMIALAAWIGKRYAPGIGPRLPRNAKRRLEIVEVRQIDPRHRLVLVRRDDIEHLLMIGASASLLVESAIGASSFSQSLGQLKAELQSPIPGEPE